MHCFNIPGLRERPVGTSPRAARFAMSARMAPALLVWALLGAFGSLDSAKAQAPNPRAVVLTPISDRNSESDSFGTRPGPLPSFQVSLRDANTAGTNAVVPTQDVFVTLGVQNLTPATADSNPEALIATVAQPVFQQQQVLLFTPANYDQPQVVTVQGVDGNLADGDQIFRVRILSVTSGDPGYDNLASANGQEVQGVNTDNDAPNNGTNGIDVRTVDNQRLGTLETNENGASAQFSVVLRSQPTSDVTINLQTTDPTEGKILDLGVLVDSTSITFSPDPTASNAYNVPQIVTVQGIDDTLADGDVPYRIIATTSTTDPIYAAIDPQDVLLVNNDNETPGLTLSPNFVVVFEGQTATISAVLNRAPTSQVLFNLSVDDATEARLNRSQLVFTASNYDVPQDIIVTGVKDNLLDGDQPFIITVTNAVSSDPNYNGKFGATVNGVTIDTDTANVNIQPPGGLQTTEQGGTATFQLSLSSMPQPGTTVTINLSSSNTSEGTVSPTSVVFTPANFNVPQTITIKGVDDLFVDGDQSYQIDLSVVGGAGSDPNYRLLNLQPVTVVNKDDGETAGITVSPTTGLKTSESGGSATFSVSLNSQPTATVTLKITSSDTTEGIVTPSVLTFTTSNFATPQAVTVTGVDDAIDDGNKTYKAILEPLSSGDPKYRFNPADLSLVNMDDDTRGVAITPNSGLVTTEAGGKAKFHVALNSQPLGNVTLDLSTTATKEITFSPTRIIFTPGTPPAGSASNVVRWDRGLDVTVTGVNDTIIDGDQPWTIITAPLVSPSDPLYNGFDPVNVKGINQDNDSAGLTITPQFILVSEGSSTTFTVVLNAKPTTQVVLPLSINTTTEAILDKTQLVFTPSNYNVPQTVTVTGISDGVADGNKPIVITVGAPISGDPLYSALPARTINGLVLDNAVKPGVSFVGPTPNQTNEDGSSVTFSVVLTTQPAANVTLNLHADNANEGLVTPATVVFTPANYDVPQAVTVTGVDDSIDDGDVNYKVITDPLISGDPRYNNLNPVDIPLVNVDDDTRGITITPATGLTTTEAGGTDTFHVALTSQPKANVKLILTNETPDEVKLSLTTIVLTPQTPATGSAAGTARWDIGVDVIVTGVDDQLLDGNQAWTIHTDPLVSADPLYDGINPVEVTGTNQDDDAAGITVNPQFIVVTEGKTTTITVVLNAKPTADVTLPLSVDDATEVILSKKKLVFTSANFNVPQTVLVTGINDQILDGNQPFAVTFGPAVSSDVAYNALPSKVVNGTCIDVAAKPAVVVSAPDTKQTTEGGGAATFTVVLTTQPTSNVTVNLRSNDTTEGIATPGRLTFTPLNYNVPQVVTVTGVDDAVDDGNIAYSVVIDPTISGDPNYNNIDPNNVALVNVDDDTRGVTIVPDSGLITTEAGGTATFHVSLTSRPAGNVTLNLSTNNSDEITFSPTQIIFTPNDPPTGSASNVVRWDRGKTVTVTGVDDALSDGDQPWTIITAALVSPSDPLYNGFNPVNVTGINQDNESPGITVKPQFILVSEGSSTTFTVVLNTKPTTQVVLPLSIDTTTEAILDKTQLVFTPSNYNVPQTVTVTGISDGVADGNKPIVITIGAGISGDPLYSGQFQTTLNGLVLDDAVKPGVSFVGPTPNQTNEDGSSVTFSVVLTTQPAANVTLNLHADNANEGLVTPATVVFTPANYDVPQAVTVTGVDDSIDDGDVNYKVITDPLISGDPRYNNLNPVDIPLVNVDDDTRGITITPATGLTTTEAGGTDTFHVALTSQPKANVKLVLTNNDPDEVKLSLTTIVLTPQTPAVGSAAGTARWDIGVDVIVTGVDDQLLDSNQAWTIHTDPLVSADPLYDGVNPVEVTGTNQDDDAAGITVNPQFLIVAEKTSTTFTVVLNAKPAFNVLLPLTVSNNEVMIDKTELVFTPANFNVPQTVRVTGINDGLKDGPKDFQIIVGPPLTSDSAYRSVLAVTIDGICRDLGVKPGITVTDLDTTQTSEKGDAATFSVVLNTQPSAVVTLDIRSTDTSEGVVTPKRLTFNSLTWNTPQVVTVTGVDDKVDDGNIAYQVITDSAISQDPNYDGAVARDFKLVNFDDDTRGVTITPSSGLVTTEAGGKAIFNVRLDTQPTGKVTLNLSTNNSDEITFNPTQITFTRNDPPAGSASNVVRWDRGLNVTVTGVDDALNDGDQPWTIVTAALVSPGDPLYNGFNPANVTGINQDDETPGLIISPRILVTTEGQGSPFTARLTVKPTANVRFALSVDRPSEVSLSQNFLLFTPTDYNQPHTITLNGVRDFVRDGDQPFTLTIADAVSSDPAYSGKFGTTVPGTNIDVDIPGITVDPKSGLKTTELGGIAEFTVVLNSRPQAGTVVVIKVASSDQTEGRIVLPASGILTFDPTNFNVPQTVRVKGVDDLLKDGDQAYKVILNVDTTAANADPDFNFVSPSPVNVRNLDNEKPGVTITPVTDLSSTEAGGGVVFNVALNAPPTATVTLTLKSSDTGEGRLVDPTTGQTDIDNTLLLTFTTANFNTPQKVTVRGIDDKIDDGDVAYNIKISTSSADAGYGGLAATLVNLVNTDDDDAGITITPITGLDISESGTTDSFTVVLNSQPTSDVTLTLKSSDDTEASIKITTIVFTSMAPTPTQASTISKRYVRWNQPVTVAVTGVKDNVQDGDRSFRIITDQLVSTDPLYKPIDPPDVRGTTRDIDVPGVIVIPGETDLRTTESGGEAEVRVRLGTKPKSSVSIPFSVSDTTEARVNIPKLTFTPEDPTQTDTNTEVFVRWDNPGPDPDHQTRKPVLVKIFGVDDKVEDGDIGYQIKIGTATSLDADYNGIDPDDLPAVNADNDDLTRPIVTITSPIEGASVNQLSQITGTADDPASTATGVSSGINTVQVRIYRVGSGYYNGTTFDTDYDAVKHLLTASYDPQTKVWILKIPTVLPGGQYFAVALATDNADKTDGITNGNATNVGISDKVNFSIDTVAPAPGQVVFTTPVNGGVYTTLSEAAGTASDDVGGSGINRVRVILFHYEDPTTVETDAGYLLPNGTFSAQYSAKNLLDTVGDPSNGQFKFTFLFTPPLGAGKYYIQAQAEDNAGNTTLSSQVVFTIRNTTGGTTDFFAGQTYLISFPYMNSDAVNATTTPDEAFNLTMFDSTGAQRYQLYRFDALNEQYVLLAPNDTLRRGEGYFLKPATDLRILRPGDDPSRTALDPNIRNFTLTLRRNPSADPADQNNGFNLIGDPFSPEAFIGANWVDSRVTYNGTTYPDVASAAAAGIMDSRLFVFNTQTGGYDPVTTNIEPLKGYYVKTYFDGVQVTLTGVSPLPNG